MRPGRAIWIVLFACQPLAEPTNVKVPPSHEAPVADGGSAQDGSVTTSAGSLEADGGSPPAEAAANKRDTDPMALHAETQEELLALFTIKPLTDKEQKVILPEPFLKNVFNVGSAHHANQGNKALSSHAISKAQCLAGLGKIVLQTPEQKKLCGADNMVPVHLPGKDPYFCIDIFEFPNKACELPVVWMPPTYAKKVCELQGKRLCSQIEWQVACRGDPDNGPDRKYAYGDKLDLDVCNTRKPPRGACSPISIDRAWATCNTDSEPAGSFPQCRSRFGVYDQHGNVAEIMMRRDETGQVVSQLKGSAWFYEPIAREPGVPAKPSQKGVETYPDHCNFDPRWHVEPIVNAWHVNYHLGFRCCKSVP